MVEQDEVFILPIEFDIQGLFMISRAMSVDSWRNEV